MATSRASVIEKKLDQKASDSKKALYASLAGICILVVFGVSSYLILAHSEVAKDIVELANLVVMAFMALAVTIITGQAAFDWKAVSALQRISMDEQERKEQVIESNQALPQVMGTEINNIRRDPKDYLLTHDRAF